jgi:hypothetical protein
MRRIVPMSDPNAAVGMAKEAFSTLKASEDYLLSDAVKDRTVQKAQVLALLSISETTLSIERGIQNLNERLKAIEVQLAMMRPGEEE